MQPMIWILAEDMTSSTGCFRAQGRATAGHRGERQGVLGEQH